MSFPSFKSSLRALALLSLLLSLPAAIGAQTTNNKNKSSTYEKPTPPPPPPPKPAPAPRPAPQPVAVPHPISATGVRPSTGVRPIGPATHPGQPVNRPVAIPRPIAPPLPRPGNLPERSVHAGERPGPAPLPMHRADPALARRLEQPRPAGFRDVRAPAGGFAHARADGRLADFHDPKHNLTLHNNLVGGRRLVIDRRGDGRLVIDRGRPSFIEHPYTFRNQEFARRTYVVRGRVYQRFYAPYGFHGVRLAVYTPARYYSPAFYGYAFHPFPAPVAYVAPPLPPAVVTYSAAYYKPAVVTGPPQFLAAYTMQTSLAAGYQAQADNGNPPAPIPPGNEVSEDVQQQLAGEIQNQLALENYEATQAAQNQPVDPASSGIARMLSDGQPHVFVAGTEVDAVDANGNECAVTEGDILALDSEPDPEATVATLSVLASKGGHDCAKGSFVTIALSDLQDMQNHLRETIDDGLEQLQAEQASGALPPAPAGVDPQPVPAAFAAIAPPPDPYAQKEIDKELKSADKDIGQLSGS